MARRKLDPPRRLKQSSLLGGFSKGERQVVLMNSGINTLEDDDPYKFEGSQSLEIRDYKVPLQPHGHGKPNQTGRKSSNLPTPPVQTAKIKKVKKIKRSPAALTENERLQAQEEQDLQHALEASRQDAEREDRKRKRDHRNRGEEWEGQGEEMGEHSHLQKRIKETTEDGLMATSTKSSPLTSPPLTSTLGPAAPKHVDGGIVPITMVSGGESSTVISPCQPAASITTFPSSQLKSVSIKKLSVKKSGRSTARLGEESSLTQPIQSHTSSKKSDKLTLCRVSVNRTPIVINADKTISKCAGDAERSMDPVQGRGGGRGGQGEGGGGGGGGGGEESGNTTPVLDIAREPNTMRVSTSLQNKVNRADVVTPPLSSSLPRLPANRVVKVSDKKLTKLPRRKLALSYSRKREALSAAVCDETVEIVSASNGPGTSPVNGCDADLANIGSGRSGDPHIMVAAPSADDLHTQHNHLTRPTASGVDHVTISLDDAGDHVTDARDHVTGAGARDHVTDARDHVTGAGARDHVTDARHHVINPTSTVVLDDADPMMLSPEHKAERDMADHRDKDGVAPSAGLAGHRGDHVIDHVTSPGADDDHVISVVKKRRLALGHRPPVKGTGKAKESLEEVKVRSPLSLRHQIPKSTGTSCEPSKPKGDLEEVKVQSPLRLRHQIPKSTGTSCEPSKPKGDLEEVKVQSPLRLRHQIPKSTGTSCEPSKPKGDLEEVKVQSPLRLRHQIPKSTGTSCELPKPKGDLKEVKVRSPRLQLKLRHQIPPPTRTSCDPPKAKGDLEEVKVRSPHLQLKLRHQITPPIRTSCEPPKAKEDLGEVKIRSPPPVYADGNVSPADYTKVILGRFDSYFCQLAKAQSQVLTRVQWAEPISSVRKNRSRKNKSPPSIDIRMKYSLKIISPATLSLTTAGHVDHDGMESDVERPKALGCPNDSETIGCPSDIIESPTDIGSPNDCMAIKSPVTAIGRPNNLAAEGYGPLCDDAVSDNNAEVSRSGYLSGWEMSGGRNDYSSDSNSAEQPYSPPPPNQHFQGSVDMWAGPETCDSRAGHSRDDETDASPPPPHETILISTQCSPILVPTSVKGWHVDRRGSQLKSRATTSPSPCIDDVFARNSTSRPAFSPRPSSPFDGDLSPVIARCDDGTSDILEQGKWLNSKKPPLSAKKRKAKTPNGARLATSRVKKKTPRRTTGEGNRGKGGRSKGTAAGRLLRNMGNVSSNDEEPEGGEEGLRERLGSDPAGLRKRLGGGDDDGCCDSSESEIITSSNKRKRRKVRVSSDDSSKGSSGDEAGESPMGRGESPLGRSSFVSHLIRGRNRGVSTSRRSRADVIDLTDEPRRQDSTMNDEDDDDDDDDDDGGSSTKFPCPVCNYLFEDTEIQSHVNQCLKTRTGGVVSSDGDDMPKRNLRKRLLTSKGAKEKGEGQGGPLVGQGKKPAKRAGQRRPTAKGAGEGTSKMPQRTLTDFQAAGKVTKDDDDVIDLDDLTPPSPMDATPPSSQSDQRDGSYNHPRAIRCEDGGYLIDPSTISTSPIRSFKRIDDLAPEQRAGFQNQFQGKQGGGRRRSSRGGQGVNSWTGRDDFDELLGNSSSNHDFPRRYQGRKSGGSNKRYWKRKKNGQR